ncbi:MULTISPECIES: RusA family crossover junction endodeoxyribonuclease [Pseudomonas]|uniref:RusA family crossover junction endodeoxyribonuclease n=1 Tax=Pseudomonas TaxID=286 RepID=UPI000BB5AA90|nr:MULTISPECIES: RusA family crossover junction endodeoxyribonuclease [Pseudomonas]MBC8878610.1 RusA family crossover junction endodeoxyribonuclease [Pseudomonas cerasi]MCK9696186.1 RusA family crossover junction endodeoxyribonuclease [Pseudomonas syringae pv. syringae]MCK9724957.1 RusA family crossover junction endodeoxyribonuclease [Pseudomonas syringae pv. syringae]MCK9775895.1 RusA family crossover junction endodeoxyribonuclease [Pseudomonas syringae pv. syringae]MCZ0949212.1 RusA family c
MLHISFKTSNCDQNKQYLIKEMATASVSLEIHFDEIVSTQSRAERKQELTQAIQRELSQFKWLISGSVQIEFAWYLHSIQRQETDKVGDIDNITKPILDALTGPDGILIDDSQIGSVHTFWMSRNEQLSYSVLRLSIQFSNDDCLDKQNLVFIQYWNAMCVALNVDFADQKSIFCALFVVRARKIYRSMASWFRETGANADRFLIQSTWEFHRTRVGGFPRESVLSMAQFNQRALNAGLDWGALRKLRKALGRLPSLRVPAHRNVRRIPTDE